MRRDVLALLAAGALLLAVLPAADAARHRDEREDEPPAPEQGRGQGQGQGRGRSGPDSPQGDPQRPSGEDDAEGRRRDHRPSVGAFSMGEEGSVQGRHVAFTYNETGIQNFTAGGVTLFNLTVEEGERVRPRVSSVDHHGPAFKLEAPSFRFKAHDNPVGVLHLQTDGTVILDFAGATLAPAPGDHVRFMIGDLTGVVKTRDYTLENQTILAQGDVVVTLDRPLGPFDTHRPDIARAIGRGHVGAEAILAKTADRDGGVAQDIVSYGNVTMTTLKAERGNLTLAIEGHGTEGRVLVLNVDGRVVGAQKKDDLLVTLDNLTIPQADDVPDVLDPENDGYTPEYYVVFDPATESFQLLVSVPHYSVHILSVNTIIPLPPPPVVFGIVAGVAVLVPGAYALFRRRPDE